MLLIPHRDLPDAAARELNKMQASVDEKTDYPARVAAARQLWDAKASNTRRAAAFRTIRSILATMCIGTVRCAYCEDSLADEIEHIYPKSLFPQWTFRWPNYAFACGPCNGPKGNRYGFTHNSDVIEFVRRPNDAVVPPPAGDPALLDPRSEDPTRFLELDLGGVTPDGLTAWS
jgi:5-methylcytosine-specific restriction endonuclease McrA